jgi:hypothetical protein
MSEEPPAKVCEWKSHALFDATLIDAEDRLSIRHRCRRYLTQGNRRTRSGDKYPCAPAELRETPFAPSSRVACHPKPVRAKGGGAGGIRTLDRALQPYNGLANRRLQPLGHSSVRADMPDTGVSRKRQISGRGIWSGHDSTLANGFLKPKPGAVAAEARCGCPRFDMRAGRSRCRKIATTSPDKIGFASRDARIRVLAVKYRNAF